LSDNGAASTRGESIFEKFRQVGDTLTDKPHGTGLGLPISRQIVRQFGGTLWVESIPSQGATFSFTLPVTGAARGQ
jgi:signal transduction histidine kinase